MINNGGKSGGNPYHDENGHFTSKGNQGSAQPKSDPIVDFNRSLWDMYFGGQPQMPKKKTTGEKVLNQMGLTNEEVMEKHEEMSDEKALNDLGEKMDKLEEKQDFSFQPENDNNPKYDYIKLLNDGEDAEITIPIELPVYNDGQGGEESEVNFEFNELMDFLIDKNIVNESEKAEYINTPKINKGFIHKIVEKYGDNNEVYNWLLENSYEQAEKSREREEAERYDDLEMKGKER